MLHRLFSAGQQSRLLSFPEDFNQDLCLWLQRQQLLVSCRLFSEGQQSRLLSFPDDFNPDLYLWLQRRLAATSTLTVVTALRHLTWLHELRLKKYDAAAGTLADVTNKNEVRPYQGLTWPLPCEAVPMFNFVAAHCCSGLNCHSRDAQNKPVRRELTCVEQACLERADLHRMYLSLI